VHGDGDRAALHGCARELPTLPSFVLSCYCSVSVPSRSPGRRPTRTDRSGVAHHHHTSLQPTTHDAKESESRRPLTGKDTISNHGRLDVRYNIHPSLALCLLMLERGGGPPTFPTPASPLPHNLTGQVDIGS
jgi:hypothetical protein